MGILRVNYDMAKVDGEHRHLCVSAQEYCRFCPDMLRLGDLSREGDHVDAMAAMIDLKGFTSFCCQMDPQLVIPRFLESYLDWLFRKIRMLFTKEEQGNRIVLWGRFPFSAKFLGDGILFLWDTKGLGQASLGNIVVNLYKLCRLYEEEYVQENQHNFIRLPDKLSCGIACGLIVGIGGNRDFVGSCINMASRLHEFGQLTFATIRKGLEPDHCFGSIWRQQFIEKRVSIRGYDRDEVLLIDKDEWRELAEEQRNEFKDA